VTIAGGSELWHFNGASPAGYPLAERLTAGAGGLAGTFRWSVVSGSSIAGFSLPGVPFPLPFAFDPAVSLVSLAPSVALNDVQVRVDFTGVAGGTGTATRQFTVRTPQSLTPTGVTSTPVLHTPPNAPTVRGWQSLVGYSIKDQFLTTLPRNVDVNEKWDDKPPINDVAGTNWAAPTEGNANVSPAGWNDKLRSPGDSIPPSVIPTPTAPGSGGPLVYHFRGHWQVGSPTTGSGKRVRSVTWRFFQDHGDHA
jgi:hypothetical protein